jgi:hypothetical protein
MKWSPHGSISNRGPAPPRLSHTPTVLPMHEHTVLFVSGLLHTERRRLGTRAGRQSLGCYRQAILMLRWTGSSAARGESGRLRPPQHLTPETLRRDHVAPMWRECRCLETVYALGGCRSRISGCSRRDDRSWPPHARRGDGGRPTRGDPRVGAGAFTGRTLVPAVEAAGGYSAAAL